MPPVAAPCKPLLYRLSGAFHGVGGWYAPTFSNRGHQHHGLEGLKMDGNLFVEDLGADDESLADLTQLQALMITTLRDGIERVSLAARSGLSAAELALETHQTLHKLSELRNEQEVQRLQDEIAGLRKSLEDTRAAMINSQNEAADLRLQVELLRFRVDGEQLVEQLVAA